MRLPYLIIFPRYLDILPKEESEYDLGGVPLNTATREGSTSSCTNGQSIDIFFRSWRRVYVEKKFESMPPKKQRVQAHDFVTRIVNILDRNNGRIRIDSMYSIMNLIPSEQSESIICEHPSLHIECGYLEMRPFAQVSNQCDIRRLCAQMFPKTLRKIDLVGMYPFVAADIDEMLFTNKIVVLDAASGSFTVLPPVSHIFTRYVVDLWHNVE